MDSEFEIVQTETITQDLDKKHFNIIKDQLDEIIGYGVSGHPMGPTKKWINRNKTLISKEIKANKYLEKLNNLTEPMNTVQKYNLYGGIFKRRKHGFSVVNPQTCKNEYFINKILSVKQNYATAFRYYQKVYLGIKEQIEQNISVESTQNKGCQTEDSLLVKYLEIKRDAKAKRKESKYQNPDRDRSKYIPKKLIREQKEQRNILTGANAYIPKQHSQQDCLL